jgi:hypothetical protein
MITYSAIKDLGRIPEDLYRKLLNLHGPALRQHGFDPERATCHDLWEEQRRLPEPFLRLVLDLHGLTSDAQGRKRLQVTASLFGVALTRGVRPIQQAVELLLQHPGAFREAVAVGSVEPGRPMFELVGRELLEPQVSAAAVEAARAELADHFEERSGARFCEIQHWTRDGQLFFQVDYTLPHTGGRRWNGSVVKTNAGWPIQTDLVVFEGGYLRIGADYENRELLRTVFGRMLFRDPGWFRSMVVVSFDPLRDTRRAFAPTADVSAVRLVHLRKHGKDRVGVVPGKPHPHVGAGYRVGTVAEARLAIQHRADLSWRAIGLHAPNAVSTGSWSDDRVARRFLSERGFLLRPLENASPSAETCLLVRPCPAACSPTSGPSSRGSGRSSGRTTT